MENTFFELLESKRMRLDSLTGMRWWAAFGVFAFHMRVFADLPHLGAYANWGYMGVAFFFILSGFVITWSFRPATSAATFYWRRIGRIYPSHFVALCLAIPVFYASNPNPAHDWVKPYDWKIIALSLPVLQGWSRDPKVLFSGNPAAWTLSLEFFFYAITPLVFWLFRPAKLWGAWALAGVSVAVIFTVKAGTFLNPEFFGQVPYPPTRVFEYFLGVALAWLIMGGVRFKIPPMVPLILIFTLITYEIKFAPGLQEYWVARQVTRFAVEIIVLLFAVLIYAAAVRDLRGGFSTYRFRPLVVLGEWSFCFYLVHATIMYALLGYVGYHEPTWENWKWYALCLALALIGAGALHNIVEKPCERWIRAWRTRHDAAKNDAAKNKIIPSAGITKG